MTSGYTAEQRSALAAALAQGEVPVCPVCGATLTVQAVAPRTDVAYVRRRVLLLCPGCKRRATVDARQRPS